MARSPAAELSTTADATGDGPASWQVRCADGQLYRFRHLWPAQTIR